MVQKAGAGMTFAYRGRRSCSCVVLKHWPLYAYDIDEYSVSVDGCSGVVIGCRSSVMCTIDLGCPHSLHVPGIKQDSNPESNAFKKIRQPFEN